MGANASQITSLTVVYSTVYSGADQRKHKSSASLAFVRGIHRRPVNSRHKWPVTRKYFHLMTSSWWEQGWATSREYWNTEYYLIPWFIPIPIWITTLIVRFMGPTWGPPGADRTIFFYLLTKKSLIKQTRRWLFETPSRPLWRHCNENDITQYYTHRCNCECRSYVCVCPKRAIAAVVTCGYRSLMGALPKMYHVLMGQACNSNITDKPVKFQSDRTIFNTIHSTIFARSYDKISYLILKHPETAAVVLCAHNSTSNYSYSCQSSRKWGFSPNDAVAMWMAYPISHLGTLIV